MTKSKYDRHVSTGSKGSIFTFIAAFIACLLFLDNTASLFTGIVFVVVGMFTVSVAVAMPFYFYKKTHLKRYSIASMIEFLVTIVLTLMFFSYFFTNSFDTTTSTIQSDDGSPYIVRCAEPVIEFTLGMDIVPSKAQTDAVCSCIWKALSLSDKNLSASLARHESHDASETQLNLFIGRFGVATEFCRTEGR